LFNFFLLGHRFIAHRQPKDIEKVLFEEARETQRKVAWKDAVEDTAKGPLKVQVPRFVTIKKGTEAPEEQFEAYDSAVADAVRYTKKQYDIASKLTRWNKNHDVGEWNRTFNDLKKLGRFMACDKNLGVKFVPMNVFNKYVERERKNYHPASIEYSEPSKMKKLFKDFIEEQYEAIVSITSRILIHAPKAKIFYKVAASRELITKGYITKETKLQCAIAQVIDMFNNIRARREEHDIPILRLLLKVHKSIGADGLYPTRPIIPNCRLPGYLIGKWISKLMSKMVKQIPWALESTQQFKNWLGDSTRGRHVRCYDFTNLYGCEPVKETMSLFQEALESMPWNFNDDEDASVMFELLMTPVSVPREMEIDNIIGDNAVRLFTLIVAWLVRHTIAKVHNGEGWKVVMTFDFLAMGCPPVAPLSIITLALLEQKALGRTRCERGMCRLIDDIVVDEDIITERELRAIYPQYLTLNHADDNHYLDVSFVWTGKKFATWPYVKPNAVIPLNFLSMHPGHIIKATAESELRRLLGLCSDSRMYEYWTEFWATKYELAGYPPHLLAGMLRRFIDGDSRVRKKKADRDINHVEKWRGMATKSAYYLNIVFNNVRSKKGRKRIVIAGATSVESSLLRTALREPRDDERKKAT